MNWRTVTQLSVAAIVGAVIFESGRIVAMRDYLHADLAVEDSSDVDVTRPARIAEAVRPTVAKKSASEAASVKEPEFKRKKFADPPLTPKDQEMIAVTELIVNNEDINAALNLAPKAAKSSRSEVREAAVRMIAWFGKKAIAELTPYLADRDEGVAMEAAAQWKRIFANECDDAEKLSMAELVLNRLTSDSMLEDLDLDDMFNDVDERAAVETIIAVIRKGNAAGVKRVKAAYETITGETWKDEATARKWVNENAADPV